MTDTTTEAVERLMKDVTPGPWEAYHYHSDKLPTLMGVTCPSGDICASVNINELRGKESIANAAFIAASRDLVPALLAERDALRAQLAASQTPDPVTNADSCQPTRTYEDGVRDAAAVAAEYARQPATGNRDHDAGWDNAATCIDRAIIALIKGRTD